MGAGLTLLSDSELDGLRARIVQLTRMGTPDQRAAVAEQLEAIDLELERRLSRPRPESSDRAEFVRK